MGYTKQTWNDNASGGTPITAARLNHIEDGIYQIGASVDQVLQKVYPIGALYLSFTSTNPKTLFGFGTWTQINGYVLRAANDTKTGGSDSISFSGSGTNYGLQQNGGYGGKILVHAQQHNAGEGVYLNNLPRYQNVYAWRRTA